MVGTVKKPTAMGVWHVSLNDGDWYWVFARSRSEAERVVRDTHYDDMDRVEFRAKYKPNIWQIPPADRLCVNSDSAGQKTKTARAWAKNEMPGPFVSNTYEI